MEGWIKLHRKFIEWEWYKDKNTKIIFLHLLLLANHKDNKWQGVLIERGQLITSIEHLSRECGLTLQQTRTALNKLKTTGEITTKATNKYSLITIENYGLYQDKDEDNNKQNNGQDNTQITNKQQTNNKQITTNKNEKNEIMLNKGKNNIVVAFETNICSLTPFMAEKLFSYLDDIPEELILESIRIAAINNKKSLAYIEGILKQWINKGYKTLSDIAEEKKPHEETTEERVKRLLGG